MKPLTCSICRYAKKAEDGALVCYRNPPGAVVLDNKARTMRPSVLPDDPACGEYGKKL